MYGLSELDIRELGLLVIGGDQDLVGDQRHYLTVGADIRALVDGNIGNMS